MSKRSKKFASFAASLVTLTVVSSAAHAQIDVLTEISGARLNNGPLTTTYTFSSSMILNSIGFYTNGDTPQSLSYSINGASQSVDLNSLSTEVSGFRWLTLSNPTTILQNQSVAVTTLGKIDGPRYKTHYVSGFTVNASSNVSSVTHTGPSGIRSNSNLRVSAYNPGSNVAPEPGTFALALTGGGALLGICIRRRRNAG
ncbi:MAG: PEP-CTERM sorting domain-containing protein [Armatimonadaceae bacterium]